MTECISNSYPIHGITGLRPQAAGGTFLEAVTGAARNAMKTLRVWQNRAAERRHMAELDDRILRDIGVSRLDIHREIAKPFWRP